MKVVNKLNKIIKEIDGNIIGIGLKDEVFLNTIAKNDNIISCNLLESFSKESGKGTNKKVKVSKLRKKFKKKKTDYIICNIDTVKFFIKKFISDSIYLNKKFIYIYQNSFADLERIIVYYSRYSKNIEKIKCEDGIILKIETNCNTNKLKEGVYKILNFFSDIGFAITELLLK